jgi:DNA-binding MarR family transcriptional regulator
MLDKKLLQKLADQGMRFWDHFRIYEQSREDSSMLQFHALRILKEEQGIQMNHLSEILGTSTAAITNLVDRMESKELIRRIPNKNDRRKINLRMTELGHNELTRLNDEMLKEIQNLYKGIKAEDLAIYLKIQEKIIRNMDELTN